MPREGELTYYEAVGEAGRLHAINKPFSDPERGPLLMQVGAIVSLLPPPPARVLECGCGPGWLCQLLQKCGFDVTGIDVSPDAIHLAVEHPLFPDAAQPTFQVADAENLPFTDEFDAVLFFGSLHHTVDEQAAIDGAYRALKAGGCCITSETGPGHARKSQEVAERFNVTEKDMPPTLIRRLGRRAGFRRVVMHPRADEVGKYLYLGPGAEQRGLARWKHLWPFNHLMALAMILFLKRQYGIVVLHK
jgi:ubiquinone/menaquinone biosynthesis C-methylase UbiE